MIFKKKNNGSALQLAQKIPENLIADSLESASVGSRKPLGGVLVEKMEGQLTDSLRGPGRAGSVHRDTEEEDAPLGFKSN